MKEKNRFSVLLEHLTSMANLKNYTIAKAVQYDESYISKWISGKLLPAEKNHEIIFQNISECIVNSLNPDTISMFLQEYQVRNLQDLKIAIYDNLEAEYSYVKELLPVLKLPQRYHTIQNLLWISSFLNETSVSQKSSGFKYLCHGGYSECRFELSDDDYRIKRSPQ